jgi:hypothetical protein
MELTLEFMVVEIIQVELVVDLVQVVVEGNKLNPIIEYKINV